MLKIIFYVLGWLGLVTSGFNIAIKLLGTDDQVLRYAGSSRHLDFPASVFAVGLVFLGLASIIDKLDEILQRDKN